MEQIEAALELTKKRLENARKLLKTKEVNEDSALLNLIRNYCLALDMRQRRLQEALDRAKVMMSDERKRR